MTPDLRRLQELVRAAAREELLPRFAGVSRHIKHDGSIVTQADLAVQERLRTALSGEYPEVGFLSEEMSPSEQQRVAGSAQPLWCLDPLDGTSNFAAGIPIFAVSLALVVGGSLRLGIVYDPLRDECFTAESGRGARLNGSPLERAAGVVPELRSCIAAVDFKRLDGRLAARLAECPPYASQRNFGTSSLEWCWLAEGRFHLYLHGGQKLWDHAAGSLILAEAGGLSATLEGEVVFTLDLKPRSVVAARHPGLFEVWKAWLEQQLRSITCAPSQGGSWG